MVDHTKKMGKRNLKTLRAHIHKQLEFFIADDVGVSSFRDEIASMERSTLRVSGAATLLRGMFMI